MPVTIFIITLSIALLFIINPKNRFSWFLSLYFISICVLLISSLLYITSFSSYTTSSSIDHKLYAVFKNFSLQVSSMARLENIGIAIFLGASFLFTVYFNAAKRNIFIILHTFLILYFIIFNDPKTCAKMYLILNYYDRTFVTTIVEFLINSNKVISIGIIFTFIATPFLSLKNYFQSSRVYIKRKHTIITAIILAVCDIFFLSLFVFGSLESFMPYNVTLLKCPTDIIRINNFKFTPYITLILLIFVIFIVIFLKPFNNLTIVTKKDISKNSIALNKNVKMLFHSYKNIFFSIEKLSDLAIENFHDNPEDSLDNLNSISEAAHNSLEHITKLLNLMSTSKTESTDADTQNCISNAIKNVHIPENIKIEYVFEAKNHIVFADPEHLKECFINIIQNSIDAINMAKRDAGIIKIHIFNEDNLVVINFFDNGCGIEKSNRNQIFKLLYSTKQNSTNYGIGLNCVKKIIKSFMGTITFKSIPDEYTIFQITLPASSQKNHIVDATLFNLY